MDSTLPRMLIRSRSFPGSVELLSRYLGAACDVVASAEPSLPGSGFFEPQDDFGFYVFAGLDGRVMARNIFLDGNSFEDSHSVEKNILVGDAQVGIAFTIRAARLAYTHVFRTPEFSGQNNADKFGALSLSLRF